MNAKTIPGFTAERSIPRTTRPYRHAGAVGSKRGQADVQPALPSRCDNLWTAYMNAAPNSYEEWVFLRAYFAADCIIVFGRGGFN